MANVFFDWSAVRVGEGQQVCADSAHSHSFPSYHREAVGLCCIPTEVYLEAKENRNKGLPALQKAKLT